MSGRPPNTPPLRLHLRDLHAKMADAWRLEFAGVEGVEISYGDIFSNREGIIQRGDGIDVRADAVVSPANSFGFMNGGIDLVFTYQLGPQVQERLQALLEVDHHGELPVGMAVIVPTSRTEIPWCISAPTMRIPDDVSKTLNAYLAMRAALRAVQAHNASGLPRIDSVLCPALGTGVGRMPAERCARQMRAAWDRVVGGQPMKMRSLHHAAQDEAELLR